MATATTKRTTTKTSTASKSTTSAVKKEQTVKKFEPTDLIPCVSVTQGLLLMPGKQSKILYRWDGYGDIREVEYRDLYSLKASRSAYIYDPLFVVDDEELLSDPRWKDVRELYDTMYDASDISAILNLSIGKFKEVLSQLPPGMKKAVKIEVASRLSNGTFDSIQKVKAVDEICGTELEKII